MHLHKCVMRILICNKNIRIVISCYERKWDNVLGIESTINAHYILAEFNRDYIRTELLWINIIWIIWYGKNIQRKKEVPKWKKLMVHAQERMCRRVWLDLRYPKKVNLK